MLLHLDRREPTALCWPMVIYIPGWKLLKKSEQSSYDLSAFRHLDLPQVDFDKISDEVAINESTVFITCNAFTKERNTESTQSAVILIRNQALSVLAPFLLASFLKGIKCRSLHRFLGSLSLCRNSTFAEKFSLPSHLVVV